MATVGLSFGSATSGTGFDVAATVTSILAISQGVETPWNTQTTALKAQDTAFTTLGTDLSTLSTAINSLTDFEGVLASKQGSSSNTDVLALSSAGSTAIAGSHSVTVASLATTSSNYSDEIANASDTLSGSLTVKVGSGSAQTITLDSTDDTLSTLAAAINLGGYGVSASIISDTNGSRLSLVSQTGGSGGQITLTPSLTDSTTSTAVGFSTGQTGADAAFTVDGVSTTSATNTVSTAIPGVTFALLAASASPVQVVIANDNSSIETALQSVVTAYNAVTSAISTQEGKDASGNAEPLFGNPTLSLIQQQLSSSLISGSASGSITNIGQLGLSLQQDGTLELDTSTLDTVLNSNFTDVQGFFQNSGSFGQTLSTALDNLGSSSSTGAISLALSQNSTEEAGLATDIANEETLIATEKTNLTTELTTANQVLQSIPSQLNEVNEVYDSLSGYDNNNT